MEGSTCLTLTLWLPSLLLNIIRLIIRSRTYLIFVVALIGFLFWVFVFKNFPCYVLNWKNLSIPTPLHKVVTLH